jgi:phosphoserine aminotransferase
VTRGVFNFSAGPALLPEPVLRQAAEEMFDWQGSGMSVMEMSHRGREFMSIHAQAQADLRELLGVPPEYRVLFMQGGALAENAIVPLNLMARSGHADYLLTGQWSIKSAREAARYGRVAIVADAARAGRGYTFVPPQREWTLSPDAAYLHVCTNETIDGVEFDAPPSQGMAAHDVPPGVPIVADVSSHILSRSLDVRRFGCLYGGAQKNIGPAGLTLVIVREDLLGQAHPLCPSAFDYKVVADNDSMFNTPPTYAIYLAGLVFRWLKAQGGVAGIEAVNVAKARLLYDAIDASDLYENRVQPEHRSRMNVPFFLKEGRLDDAFLAGAREAGLAQLKGHRAVGGMRASIYNAMPIEGVQALVAYMQAFERRHA